MLKISTIHEQYEEYKQHMQKLADVRNALAVLQWDQETYLPSKGADFRARQTATLSELAHGMATDPKLEGLMKNLEESDVLDPVRKKNVSLNLEDFNKQKKYSSAFVRLMSETISKSFAAWINSRKENRFSLFERDLDALIILKKEETEIVGYRDHPYNALLNDYEKGCTVELLDKTFDGIRPELGKLFGQILAAPPPADDFLYESYPKQQQWDFGVMLIRQLGFDFEAGRQDLSEHPFTTSFNKNDVRVTTRINEQDFNSMTWSCIHEAGHALYEQGLPESGYGLPAGEYASLGIHESQSRLWENHVGRSHSFWKFNYPILQRIFKNQLGGISLDQFYRGINKVKPSLIRTEADELTYHFHVMVRYEIEKLIIEGNLPTAEIPACWNELYDKYLGVKVPDDKQGCLQDVHWSHGSFGYFPTYSLGSFYAAQFFNAAQKQIPGLAGKMESGDTGNLLEWLRQHIHREGRIYQSEELCKKATGETLNIHYFLDYLTDKYSDLYAF
jgi:carboxypeptidase Taq